MTLTLVKRRPRGLKRAPRAVRRLAAIEAARTRVTLALAHRTEEERAVLGMLLIERMTQAEAAQVLGIEVTELLAIHRTLLRALRRAFKSETRPSRYGAPSRIVTAARERLA